MTDICAPQYPEFDSVHLLIPEKIILFKAEFKKSLHGDVFSPRLNKLREYGLITQNYLPQRNSSGDYLSDGTFSISDRGKRFCSYNRKERFRRYLTPAIVAFITSIATSALELKLPSGILDWIKGLF